jgi:anti-sigma regulatory factor (Ser/Thr protein kinase)
MRAPARPPPPLRLRLVGEPLAPQLAGVRRDVAHWAGQLGLPEEFTEDLVLATHEALANVADHAYPDGTGEAWVDLECVGQVVEVVVRDRGEWRAPPTDTGWRGRGLIIIRGLADEVQVQHNGDGTTVRMRWPLP